MGGLLEGKKVLVTGVLDRRSIAFSAARLASEQGAEVALSSFGRAMNLTARTAKRLDPEPVGRAVVSLLSDWWPATTGELIHVDGGYHAMGAPIK